MLACAAQWDGRESVDSYLRTLRRCYGALCDRFEANAAAAGKSGKAARFSIDRCCCMPDPEPASLGAGCMETCIRPEQPLAGVLDGRGCLQQCTYAELMT